MLIVILASFVLAIAQQAPQKTRVYVVDKDSWAESGGFSASNGTATASYHAGVRHISTEQIKSLNQACPAITITGALPSSDFVVVWDTKTWAETSWSGHQNEYVIYASNGDVVYTGAAHKISNAAKEICKAITQDKKGKTK